MASRPIQVNPTIIQLGISYQRATLQVSAADSVRKSTRFAMSRLQWGG
eukprot:CAMPEP_0172456732 /NCGR_PEP_ID=MMETSP1065-20121228/17449_1 /TAXON_ID=265537 /ORGANISM="Amphiprora paludosa, Strain CCMP125" /LENGTH=47 /DNA_ID= /DNA_START= /DNA_END= /DNA_ORIENTATION=